MIDPMPRALPKPTPWGVLPRQKLPAGASGRLRHQAVGSVIVVFAVVLQVALPQDVSAQAWVAQPGNLGLSVDYGVGWSEQIKEGELLIPGGTLIFQSLVLGAELVPVEGLAVRTSIPFYLMYWTSEGFDGAHGRYDDGKIHAAFQDMSWEVRYMALEAPIAVTPSLGISFPMGSYETRGNAALGRNLIAGHFGLSLGAFFDPWVPELYAHLKYVFSLVQSVDLNEETRQFDQHRSELNFQVGYFFLPELQVYLTTDMVLYHGGVNFVDWRSLSSNLQFNHDLVLREEMLLVGGGFSYQLLDNLTMDVFGRVFIVGDNTRTARSIGVSFAWNDFLW